MAFELTKEQKSNVTKALTGLADAKKEILRAKSAGIDVSNLEKDVLEQEQRLLAIKRVYGGGT